MAKVSKCECGADLAVMFDGHTYCERTLDRFEALHGYAYTATQASSGDAVNGLRQLQREAEALGLYDSTTPTAESGHAPDCEISLHERISCSCGLVERGEMRDFLRPGDSASLCRCDSPAATHRDGWCPSCGRTRATPTVAVSPDILTTAKGG